MINYKIRPLTIEDQAIVWQMLIYAAHEPSLESVQNQSILSRYAVNWGRKGDMGYVALLNQTAIGAAWLRLWLDNEQGFGYIEHSIPELAMAVLPEYRGQGIGTQLLNELLKKAANIYPAVSLNVRADNPVVSLYQRIGFIKIENSEVINRIGRISYNMICRI